MSWRTEFFLYDSKEPTEENIKCDNMFIYPEALLKTGTMFIVTQSSLHQWRFCGWVICPHFIAHWTWGDLPDLSAGYGTRSWASFKTAVTLDCPSSLKSLLCAPSSLPIPFGSTYRSLARVCWLCTAGLVTLQPASNLWGSLDEGLPSHLSLLSIA